jgi:ABC-type uncharacterized transport system substrate-binding protein
MSNKIALWLLPTVLLATFFPAVAQPGKVPRVGWIAFMGSRPLDVFKSELRARGYVEGQSIIIEYRSAEARGELSEIAAEMVRLKFDVIVAAGNEPTDAAKKASSTIPIVFMSGDPVWNGTVGSLAKPGNNLTGLSIVSFDLAGKRLELLRDAFPKISRVAVLLRDAPVHRRQFADMQKLAKALGVQLQALEYQDLMLDLDSVFQRAMNTRANALLILPNPAVFPHRTRLLDFAAKNRLAAIYPYSEFADEGGLMSYDVNRRELQRRAAYYVDRILKGAKPSDLPVEQPTKFELVVNLKAAKTLGLTIPSKILMWADRVIE